MPNEALTDRVEFRREGEAVFVGSIRTSVLDHFQHFINRLRRIQPTALLLDFRDCRRAYPNTMVPILAHIQDLLDHGFEVRCELPSEPQLRNLFLKTNWAHFLSPLVYRPSDVQHDRHLATQRFLDSAQQRSVVNQVLDVLMRTLELDRSLLGGIEWAINEITDNVLNHAESSVGGFLQVTTYRETQRIAFCVADPGRGILESLREANPALRSDADAIGEAVRAGVTRNRDVGQGNGLSGTLNIAMQTQGRFGVTSGTGRALWETDHPQVRATDSQKTYRGTVVDVQIPYGGTINLQKALSLGSTKYKGVADIIELKYLSDDCERLEMSMLEETAGFGSRRAGTQIRIKATNLLRAEPTSALVIDWNGIQMISSSYADEFIGKLFIQLGPTQFMSRVRHKNVTPVVGQLLDKAILQRVAQEQAEPRSDSGDVPRAVFPLNDEPQAL